MKLWLKLLTLALLILLFIQLFDIKIDDCDKCKYDVKGEELNGQEFFEYYTEECLTQNYQVNITHVFDGIG